MTNPAVGPASSPVVFDFTVNLTTILGVIVWLITLAIAWTKFGGRMDLLELRVTNVEKALDKIATALTLFGTNEKALVMIQEQISTLQRDQATLHETVERLRVGEGFIAGPRRGSVQGEYSRITAMDRGDERR